MLKKGNFKSEIAKIYGIENIKDRDMLLCSYARVCINVYVSKF